MKIIPERDIDRARLKVALEDLHEAVRSVEAALAREGLEGPEDWLDAWRGYACPAPPPAPPPPKAALPQAGAKEWIGMVKRLPEAADHPGGLTRLNHWGQPVPIEHVPCLVVRAACPREVILRQWNLVHQCSRSCSSWGASRATPSARGAWPRSGGSWPWRTR